MYEKYLDMGKNLDRLAGREVKSHYGPRRRSSGGWLTAEREATKRLAQHGTKQYIGRPGGPKAKGHKVPATTLLPTMRFSVIPR